MFWADIYFETARSSCVRFVANAFGSCPSAYVAEMRRNKKSATRCRQYRRVETRRCGVKGLTSQGHVSWRRGAECNKEIRLGASTITFKRVLYPINAPPIAIDSPRRIARWNLARGAKIPDNNDSV